MNLPLLKMAAARNVRGVVVQSDFSTKKNKTWSLGWMGEFALNITNELNRVFSLWCSDTVKFYPNKEFILKRK